MKTIEAQIPEPVLKQAQELAARENVPLEQIISLAITHGTGQSRAEEIRRATSVEVP